MRTSAIILALIVLSSCELNRQTRSHYADDFPAGIEVGGIRNLNWDEQVEYTSIFDNPPPTKKPKP